MPNNHLNSMKCCAGAVRTQTPYLCKPCWSYPYRGYWNVCFPILPWVARKWLLPMVTTCSMKPSLKYQMIETTAELVLFT